MGPTGLPARLPSPAEIAPGTCAAGLNHSMRFGGFASPRTAFCPHPPATPSAGRRPPPLRAAGGGTAHPAIQRGHNIITQRDFRTAHGGIPAHSARMMMGPIWNRPIRTSKRHRPKRCPSARTQKAPYEREHTAFPCHRSHVA